MAWNGSNIKPTAAETAQKRKTALEMRVQGHKLEEIATTLGCSITYVAKLIRGALRATIQQPADELRQLELERLDALWIKTFQLASERASKDHLDACIKIMKRRAELLGLDAPVRKELTAKDGAPLAIESNVMFYLPDNGRDNG